MENEICYDWKKANHTIKTERESSRRGECEIPCSGHWYISSFPSISSDQSLHRSTGIDMSMEGSLLMSDASSCSELRFRKAILFKNLPSDFSCVLDWLAALHVFGSDLLQFPKVST